MHTLPNGEDWEEICTLPEQHFLSVQCSVAMPGDCLSLQCWVKQQKGKNLRLVWIITQISKHHLSCSDFAERSLTTLLVLLLLSYHLAGARKPQTLFPYGNIKRSFVRIQS